MDTKCPTFCLPCKHKSKAFIGHMFICIPLFLLFVSAFISLLRRNIKEAHSLLILTMTSQSFRHTEFIMWACTFHNRKSGSCHYFLNITFQMPDVKGLHHVLSDGTNECSAEKVEVSGFHLWCLITLFHTKLHKSLWSSGLSLLCWHNKLFITLYITRLDRL